MSIKVDLLENDLPREKLLRHSARSITDTELLSILIGSGNAKESAIQIADNLLHKSSNCLHELSRYSFSELSSIQGLGPAKCSTLLAAFELGRRKRSAERKKGVEMVRPFKRRIICSHRVVARRIRSWIKTSWRNRQFALSRFVKTQRMGESERGLTSEFGGHFNG